MAQVKVQFNRGVEGATNIVDAGTEGTKVASGTTAQRGTTVGQLRYNTTLARFEAVGAGPQLLVLQHHLLLHLYLHQLLDSAGGETVVITGTNFEIGNTTVTFDGTAPSSTTVNSATSITALEHLLNQQQLLFKWIRY